MSLRILTVHESWPAPDRGRRTEVRARSIKPRRIAARIARRLRSGGTSPRPRRSSRPAWGW
jgi:hypothetical protein